MNAISKILLGAAIVATAAGVTSCKDEEYVLNPSGETYIYRLNVANGGLTGTENIAGEIDEANKTVTFQVPAETDIEAVRFTSKLSLGAKLDAEVYDFSAGSAGVTVINGENRSTYTVTLNLNEPVAVPMVQRVSVMTEDGPKNAFVNDGDKTVYLGRQGFETAEIVSVSTLPKRATWTLTESLDGKTVSADNPGKMVVDFMGLQAEYRLSFSAVPVFGADFGLTTVYDFSTNAAGADVYEHISTANTRSADFDGECMLVVSREGGIFPHVLYWDDMAAGILNPVMLDTSGIEGGTFAVSAGRLAQGHIYVCNLTTGLGEGGDAALRIYHWADEYSPCEAVLEFDGVLDDGTPLKALRLGDNMSISLDEAGNGTAWFVTQDGTSTIRFDVTGFTSFTNPTPVVMPGTANFYASVQKVDGSDNEFVYTSALYPGVHLIDRDGNELFSLPTELLPARAADIRIINYDSERYLILTTGRQAAWAKEDPNTFMVYDISDGANTLLALANFVAQEDPQPLFTYSFDGAGNNACWAGTGWGVGADGKLRLMSAAVCNGFALFEVPERE